MFASPSAIRVRYHRSSTGRARQNQSEDSPDNRRGRATPDCQGASFFFNKHRYSDKGFVAPLLLPSTDWYWTVGREATHLPVIWRLSMVPMPAGLSLPASSSDSRTESEMWKSSSLFASTASNSFFVACVGLAASILYLRKMS